MTFTWPSAREKVVPDNNAGDVPILERKWYYSIEVEPGIWTDGRKFGNVALTRAALHNIDVGGLTAVDIGCMEALVPILLCRRGARHVTAFDHHDRTERLAFLKSKLGVNFDVRCGIPLSEFAAEARQPFDLVVFSGVLYHMLDPLAGLLQVRGLVRSGGIVLVETAAVVSAELVAHFNGFGRLYPGNNYYLPTVGLLDYWLRFAQLEPLDCFFFMQKPASGFDFPCRICVPCRAVDKALAEDGDEWIREEQRKLSRDFGLLRPTPAAARPTAYTTSRTLPHNSAGTVDLYRSMMETAPLTPTPETTMLALGQIY